MSISLPYLFGRADVWWEHILRNLFSILLLRFPQHPQNLQLCYFFLKSFTLFSFFSPVSWQCVISTDSCSSAEAFTPTFCVHTILYQTETPTSEEVGITVGFRRRDSSSGGIFMPSEDNHEPTAGSAWTGVEGMTIIFIIDLSKNNVFDFQTFCCAIHH